MKKTFNYFVIIALTAVGLFLTACPENFNFDKRPEDLGAAFVPVTEIVGVPTGAIMYTTTDLSKTTVMPETATYKRIEWSIASQGGTGSTLDGARLVANGEGTVTVRATIRNGMEEGVDYTQDFPIVIALAENAVAVRFISGLPEEVTFGEYELRGTVNPSEAINTTIIWTVKNAGTTGATLYGDYLSTTARGTVVLTATVQGGLLEKGDYTHDFHIMITNPVYAAGYYGYPENPDYPTGSIKYKACYWINGELKDDLDHSGLTSYRNSYAYGMVYENGRLYISGFWNTKDGNPSGSGLTHGDHNYDQDNNPCYWVDGQRVDLPKDGVKNTRTLSIAVVGEKVYITGAEIGQRTASSISPTSWGYNDRYLWIHDRSNGSSPQRIKLEPPAGYNAFSTSPVNDRFEGRFAVDNSGHVYIPMGVSTDGLNRTGYYWDEYGIDHKIDVSTPDPWFYEANSAAIIDGNVYFAGYMQMTGSTATSQPQLFYTVLGSNRHTLLEGVADAGRVNSIVNQNGSPVFYGLLSYSATSGYSSWDTSGSRTHLANTYYHPETRSVVYTEGDVYVMMKYSASVYYQNQNFGYMALGGQMRLLIDIPNNSKEPTRGAVTAIAVPGAAGGGTVVTVPVSGVTLNRTSLTLQMHETEILNAVLTPSNATKKAVAWVSSNPHVASVSGGVITAHTVGTTNITVTTESGGHRAVCAVTVTPFNPDPVMVDIPGTTSFTMGSPSNETGRESNENQWGSGSITISAFKMGKYEVTQGQYKEVMGSLPQTNLVGIGEHYPVYGVKWIEAVVFCNKLSLREGLTPTYNYNGVTNPNNWGNWSSWSQAEINSRITFVSTNNGYHLPTEAQWEYACRAGTTTPWFFGANSSALDNYAWTYLSNESSAHPVGQKQPNAWGLYDMLGNVAEWCSDVYQPSYVTTTTVNPTGPSAVSSSERVLRGSYWRYDLNDPKYFRSAYRLRGAPNNGFVIYGFRVALPMDTNPMVSDFNISGMGPFAYNGSARAVTVTALPGKTHGAVTVYYNGSPNPPVNAGTYTVTFRVEEVVGWNEVTLTAGTLTINKIPYPNSASITWPSGLTAEDGDKLQDIPLASHSNANGSFSWATPTTSVGAVGTQSHSMIFTPSNTNYSTVTQSVSITVTAASVPAFMQMVAIPGGTFTMGSPVTDENHRSDESQWSVTISAFKMGRYEVTQSQYKEVMGLANAPGTTSGGGIFVDYGIGDNNPVYSVSWYDAIEFCNKLSEREGLTAVYTITGRTPSTGYPITNATVTPNLSADGYRLPTEAQWEYACRAGTTTAYYTGDELTDGIGWYQDNSDGKTHEVGLKTPNLFGLYDMAGNVWEWCWDWYQSAYVTTNTTDPTGPTTGTHRVKRGGCFDSSGWEFFHLRSAFRVNETPNTFGVWTGFRVALPAN